VELLQMRKLRETPPAALTAGQLAVLQTATSPGIGHNHAPSTIKELPRPPPQLQADDVLWGGQEIHDFVVELLGINQSLSATYFQIAKGVIPARKFSGHLLGSKRGIAQRLAIGTGLTA
jgi:hypothetical protein